MKEIMNHHFKNHFLIFTCPLKLSGFFFEKKNHFLNKTGQIKEVTSSWHEFQAVFQDWTHGF